MNTRPSFTRTTALVRRLPAGSPACVRGRVVLAGASRALVRDMTGNIEVRWREGAPIGARHAETREGEGAPIGARHAETREGEGAPIGAWVEVRGVWDGSCLEAEELDVVGAPVAEFGAAQGDWHWFQAGGRAERLQHRAAVLAAIRGFFDERGFLEVETPLVVPSPGLDLHLAAFEVSGRGYLITSPEYQMKRLLAGGLPKIYQLCRTFRRDEEGAHHQPEFTMLEWYRAFAGADEVMADTERLVAHAAEALHGETIVRVGEQLIDLAPPWPRRRVDEIFSEHAGLALEEVLPDETRFFELWTSLVEPALGPGPLLVTHWPASMASLARLHPSEPAFADRFEAYVGGMELCNGFGELVDPHEQRARLERDDAERAERGLPRYPIDERFLGALEEGIPPSGGNALGVDRLVMLLLGASHIDDVIAFPAHRL